MIVAGAKAERVDIVRLRISLYGVKPTVWRRFLVPASMTLRELHVVIQAAMGWEDRHLWHFHLHGIDYGPETGRNPHVPPSGFRLRGGERFSYVYDFGDWWDHEVRIEPIKPADARGSMPRCIAGNGTCPPEDCGGPPGYADAVTEALDPFGDEDDIEIMAEFAEQLVGGLRVGDLGAIASDRNRLEDLDRAVDRVRRRLRLVEPFDKAAANNRIGGKRGIGEGPDP